MYHVMVVDDEPMAASLIVNIIKRKYSDFEIMVPPMTEKKRWS